MSASTFRMNRAIPSAARTESDTATVTGSEHLLFGSLTSTVPKELVHRASVAEVMLTDWARVDENRFTIDAQWPRGHSFFAPVDGRHDPLIVAETIRQAGILLAHAEFGVPLDYRFLMWDLTISAQPANLVTGNTPGAVSLEIVCSDIKRRRNDLAGFHYEAVIRLNGQIAAIGGATFTCVSSTVYKRLRGDHCHDAQRHLPLTAPTAPQSVGRVSPKDVVLSPIGESNRWQLRVDTHHPVLFDHPVDHVPGMVLLEATRQAAVAILGRTLPMAVEGEFHRYVELDAPCIVEASRVPGTAPDGGQSVLVTGRQNEAIVFQCTMTMAPPTA